METFGSSADTVDCLLEFVAVLPEEVSGNTRIPIGDAEYHTRSTELLKDNAERVLQLLVAFMETSGVNTSSQLRVFKCLYNWLKSGDIPIDTFAATPLFPLVFGGLKDEELFDAAVDAACEIVHETRETHEHLSVIQQIYQHLTALRPNLSACADDPDQFRGYCRVYTEAGEAYQKLIVEHPDTFAELLNAMAECTAYPDLDIVPMTFNFWYALKTTLMREESAAVRPQFIPVFSHLVDVMLKHLHYPADLDTWSAQEREDFRSFRHVMGDVLKDCCSVAGSQVCLTKPVEIVTNAMSSLKQGHQVKWQDIEAPLFSMRSMGSEVPLNESVILPQIMKILPELPDHPKIRYAATLVISRYTQWTSEHPEYIPHQLTYVSNGFENSEVSSAAALALKHLCKDCPDTLAQYLSQLHPFYEKVATGIPVEDLLDVTEAIAYIVAVIPGETDFLSAMQMFCDPILAKLQQQVDASTPDNVERLNIFLRYTADRLGGTGDIFIRKYYPIIDNLMASHSNHTSLIDRLCNTYRLSMDAYDRDFVAFLPGMANRLVEVFEQTGSGACLWAAQRCVRNFGSDQDPTTSQAIFAFVERLGGTVFGLLQRSSALEMPLEMEDFFRLLDESLRANPVIFSRSQLLPRAVEAGLACFDLVQYEPLRAVLDFYQDLVTEGMSGNNSDIGDVLTEYSARLVSGLFYGMLGMWSLGTVDDAAQLLKMLTNFQPSAMAGYLGQVAAQISNSPGGPSNAVDLWQKLMRDVESSPDPTRMRRIYRDFVAVYRRNSVRQQDDKTSRTSSLPNVNA